MTVWSCAIEGGDYQQAGVATRGLKEVLRCAGVDAAALRRLMVAAYEAEMNVVIHARRGRLEADVGPQEVRVVVADEGPGIPDLERAMTEGYSTAPEEARRLGFGAGLGLPNIKKHSDSFTLGSTVGAGTCVRFAVAYHPITGAPPAATSLQIRAERCRQCGRCLRACPAGCLRLREGGPRVLLHRCIECTECALACPARVYGVESAAAPAGAGTSFTLATAGLERLPPGLPGADAVTILRERGFAVRAGLSRWAEALRSAGLRRALTSGECLISPTCPAAVSLVAARYPGLVPHLAPWLGALEAAMTAGSDRAVVACPAQRSALLAAGVAADRVLGPEELDRLLAPAVVECSADRGPARLQPADAITRAVDGVPVIRVEGARAVTRTLDLLDEGRLIGPAVLEPYLCAGGCDGSGFLSRSIAGLVDHLGSPRPVEGEGARAVERPQPLALRYGQLLDPDMGKAIQKLSAIEDLSRTLDNRDCAACGAPTCRAFAEDVVLGRTAATACPGLREGGVA